MSLEMCYMQIIGLKSELMPVIQALRQAGCVQIDAINDCPDVSLPPLEADQDVLRTQEELNRQLTQVKGLLDTLGIGDAGTLVRQEVELTGIQKQMANLIPQVQTLTTHLERLRNSLDVLPRFEETMLKLLPILPVSAHSPGNISFGLLVNKSHEQVLNIIQTTISSITGGLSEIVIGDVGESIQAMLIVVPREFESEIASLLDKEDISRLRLPSDFANMPPEETAAALRRRLAAIPEEIATTEKDLAELATLWKDRLLLWCELLRDEVEEYAALSQAGETEATFVLMGWSPVRDFEKIETVLRDEVGERVFVHQLPLTDGVQKRTPVALNNPPFVRPFESLVNLFSVPRYGGVDPTRLVGIFLPLFFGLMLGDVGYGAILLVLSLFLRRRLKGMLRNIVTIMAIGSSWSIVFGLLFGEVFGTLGESLGLHPLWFDRADPRHITDLFLLTISIGSAHITLGLLIGIWEGFREKNRHHLLERGGRLIGLVGLFTLTGVLVDFLPGGFMTPAIAGLVVGLVLLGVAGGKTGPLIAPIEFIGLLGNILSYLRIAAIGLSSVYLAVVANEIAGSLGNIVVGGIIAALLHALNILLGAFSPSIQSLRLHYVEFFRTFYEGGGRLYVPFKSHVNRT